MVRKLTLVRTIDSRLPSIDEARRGLGGRGSSDARAGTRVQLIDPRLGPIEGVIVFASSDEHDVWIGEGRFARVPARHTVAIEGADRSLDAVEADARAFAQLSEGTRVRYLDRAGREHHGVLAEKCRYGALISDGSRIHAVAFRLIRPLSDA